MKNTVYENLNESVFFYEHSSGLKVYMVTKPGFKKFCAGFSTHFGSIDNTFVPIGENEMETVPDGVAHFLEHKVFEQENGEVIFETFARDGASANAYTSFNLTNYYFWATDNYEKNLETLIRFVQSPYFTEENVKKEQGIIGQEIGMYDDNPGWRCYFNMLQGMYKNHPVRLDIAGTVQTISEITEKTLYKCYNTFYHPSNMYLCIVGDFKPEKIIQVIDKTLKPAKKEEPIPREYEDEPRGAYEHIKVQNLPVSSPVFSIGFKDSAILDCTNLEKRKAVMDIALYILFGKSSQCDAVLYENKDINGHLSFDFTCEDSTYAFAEICGESDNPEKAGNIILEMAEKAEFSNDEFKAGKNAVYGKFLSTFDDPEDYMQNLVRTYTVGLDMFKLAQEYQNATIDDVKKICKEIFTKDNYCLSIIKNK
ncbi:MAG: insulinase family protein [Clostridia bacterium]|nr:insulinase family protein [Clostridia bacterium]